jgi:hypothetical protein
MTSGIVETVLLDILSIRQACCCSWLLADLFVVLAGEFAELCLKRKTLDSRVYMDRNSDDCTW